MDNKAVIETRDAQRPSMAQAVAAVEDFLRRTSTDGTLQQLNQGPYPGPYVWQHFTSPEARDAGVFRYYCVGYSTMPGAEGYPLLTIRQRLAPNLDSDMTYSCLLVGNDQDSIDYVVAQAVVHFTGALAGFQSTMRVSMTDGFSAALYHAKTMAGENVEAFEELVEIKGELN